MLLLLLLPSATSVISGWLVLVLINYALFRTDNLYDWKGPTLLHKGCHGNDEGYFTYADVFDYVIIVYETGSIVSGIGYYINYLLFIFQLIADVLIYLFLI